MEKLHHLLTVTAISGLIAAAAPLAQGAVTWTAGAPGGTSGGALDFDQTLILDTGVATSSIYGAGGTGTGDYTVSAWINPDNVATESWFAGTTNEALHLGILDGSALRQGHWGNDSSGTTALVVGDWVHTTFAYEAGTISIYVNGVLDAANVVGAPNNTNGNLVIGGRIRNATEGPSNNPATSVPAGSGLNRQPFDGQIDDFAVWDSALTAAEVADLFNGTQSAVDLGANAYYDFEDAQTGTTAAVQGALGGSLSGITAVPEPSSLSLVLLGALGLVRRKRA